MIDWLHELFSMERITHTVSILICVCVCDLCGMQYYLHMELTKPKTTKSYNKHKRERTIVCFSFLFFYLPRSVFNKLPLHVRIPSDCWIFARRLHAPRTHQINAFRMDERKREREREKQKRRECLGINKISGQQQIVPVAFTHSVFVLAKHSTCCHSTSRCVNFSFSLCRNIEKHHQNGPE